MFTSLRVITAGFALLTTSFNNASSSMPEEASSSIPVLDTGDPEPHIPALTQEVMVDRAVEDFRGSFAARARANDTSGKWDKCYSTGRGGSIKYDVATVQGLRKTGPDKKYTQWARNFFNPDGIPKFQLSSLTQIDTAPAVLPAVMNKPIVVIDFGHGQKQGKGFETGAAEGAVYEARVAYAVGSQLSDILKKDYGVITVETRADVHDHDGFQFDRYSRFANQDKSLQIRAELVSELRDRFPDAPVLFVSLHTNRAVGADGKNIPTVHGGLMFSYSATEGGTSGSVESRKLAQDLASHYALRKRTQARTNDFAVLRCQYVDTPAVLIELGFNTNPEDRALFKSMLASEDVARRYADKLARGIGAYLNGREQNKPVLQTQIAMNGP